MLFLSFALVFATFTNEACCKRFSTEDVLDNPYEDGQYSVANVTYNPVIQINNKIPIYTTVFYPEGPGTFPFVYFVAGFQGTLPGYDEVAERVASHGYIVATPWVLVQDSTPINASAAKHLENVAWLMANMDLEDVVPDYTRQGLLCHSSGCTATVDMIRASQTGTYQATVHLEPVTMSIYQGVNFTLPALHMGTEFGRVPRDPWPISCVIEAMDHRVFYERWRCPQILMEAQGAGHCDIMNEGAVDTCEFVCSAGLPRDELTSYKSFLQGITVAFFNSYVKGNMDDLVWVTERERIPMPLTIYETDMGC